MAFLASFFEYVVVLIILAAVAVGGIFAGKTLRKKKDVKAAAEASDETKD